MKKSNRIKRWRLNVGIDYCSTEKANSYRFNILELMKHLASIYGLDYALSVDHHISDDAGSVEQPGHKYIVDLVYFRSNEYTRIQKKDFRASIDCMFRKVPSTYFEGVEVWPQLYKALNDFPFPQEFYRPLNYPFVEHHQGCQKTLYIYADQLMKAIETEQDFPSN